MIADGCLLMRLRCAVPLIMGKYTGSSTGRNRGRRKLQRYRVICVLYQKPTSSAVWDDRAKTDGVTVPLYTSESRNRYARDVFLSNGVQSDQCLAKVPLACCQIEECSSKKKGAERERERLDGTDIKAKPIGLGLCRALCCNVREVVVSW